MWCCKRWHKQILFLYKRENWELYENGMPCHLHNRQRWKEWIQSGREIKRDEGSVSFARFEKTWKKNSAIQLSASKHDGGKITAHKFPQFNFNNNRFCFVVVTRFVHVIWTFLFSLTFNCYRYLMLSKHDGNAYTHKIMYIQSLYLHYFLALPGLSLCVCVCACMLVFYFVCVCLCMKTEQIFEC